MEIVFDGELSIYRKTLFKSFSVKVSPFRIQLKANCTTSTSRKRFAEFVADVGL